MRRPDPHNDDSKKQMKFLPDMMRRRGTVQDSDESESELFEGNEEDLEENSSSRYGKKRNSDVMREETEDEEDKPLRPTPKRRRKPTIKTEPSKPRARRRQTARVAPIEPEDSSEAEEEEVAVPRLRRQSTMTQIVDGRSPAPGSAEPEFKRVKRTSRTSWGGKGNKDAKEDAKQRTLTQMIPAMTPLVLDTDEELEETGTDEEADAAHHSFIFGDNSDVATQSAFAVKEENEENVPPLDDPLPVVGKDDDSGDEYQPTQFIEAPVTRTRRTPLRASTRRQATPAVKKASRTPASKSSKSRFGLLSTPEKRRVREIQSSQSPPDTPLSTQSNLQGCTPLQRRSTNENQADSAVLGIGAETPSKRKQVTFQTGPQEQIPPPMLKKFASTIPDSEEEDANLSDNEDDFDSGYGPGEETRAVLRTVNSSVSGIDVGAETQAMLLDIDRACAHAAEEVMWANREGSEELGERINHEQEENVQGLVCPTESHVPSNETGEQSTDTPELPPLPFSSPKLRNGVSTNAEPSAVTETLTSPPIIEQLPSSPPIEDFRTQPPTPMFNDDTPEESDEPTIVAAPQQPSTPTKEEPRSSPSIADFRTQPTTLMFDDSNEPSDDLDDIPPTTAADPTPNPNHPIQVPRSPPPPLRPEPSHSSQAERQLRSEYETYSQYRRPAPMPSSMQVAHDSHYSYQATPRPLPRQPAPPHTTSTSHISQATTIDPTQLSPRVTPRKSRTKPPIFTSPSARTPKSGRKRPRSATTTPQAARREGGAGPMSSPDASRPAPLFIPSSFPSPARVTMEGWSSPLLGREGESQWGGGSLEDFSIPAPPPGSSQWVDDGDD